jgi:hypothetical protein
MTRRTIQIAAACCASLFTATLAWAGVSPQPFRTGLFGVTAGQSIRISILNAGDAAGIIEPCAHVFDNDGQLLFEWAAGPLPGGKAIFVDFQPIPPDGTPGGLPIRAGRAQVRAEVVFTHGESDTSDGVPMRPAVFASLEIFDLATGKTVYTTPFATVAGVDPQPFAPVMGVEPTPFTPPYVAVAGVEPEPFRTGLFGVTAGQSIRITVLNTGDVGGIINPCFNVLSADGTLLLDVDAETLGAGGGTFVDFTPLPDDGTPGGRVQLRAEVELEPVLPVDGGTAAAILRHEIHLTLEIYDTASGRTVFTMPFVAKAGIAPVPFRLVPGLQ